MLQALAPRRLLILGAAGRDFHVFNTLYRDAADVEVVAFTATQIPGISGRCYPGSLAGARYPQGIPIHDESALEALCASAGIDTVVFAYSDVSHTQVMQLASRALAAGAEFVLPSPRASMLRARLPVIAVSAVRTGCGKSQVARWLSAELRRRGRRVAVLRHPMPYGDLERARVQCFRTRDDLAAAQCTLEEREEYEPHLALGNPVYAGVDYAAVLAAAETEADILVWDGGNNDFPFLAPDLHIVVVDALRPGQLQSHHPGSAVLRTADVVVINKVDGAAPGAIDWIREQLADLVPQASVVLARSPVTLEHAELARGRRVLLVEDGPTVTHGGMPHGAALVAARAAGIGSIVDPRASATPAIAAVYAEYPHIGSVLPAVGYGPEQLAALAATIAASRAEVVIAGTPVDLAALITPAIPVLRARYAYADAGTPTLGEVLERFLARHAPA